MKTLALTAALFLVIACAKKDESAAGGASTGATTAVAPQSDRAATAAAISNAIAAHPASADSILQANNMTRESFDQTMYEIAADSALSARYAAAKTK